MSEPLTKEFTKGLWRENGLFVMALGLCPALAVTTSVMNGVVMGLCVTFVLVGSNLVVSLIRGFTPKEIRIPIFIARSRVHQRHTRSDTLRQPTGLVHREPGTERRFASVRLEIDPHDDLSKPLHP